MEHEGLLGEQTDDLVFYKAKFKDPRIELVAQLADKWVEDLYPLIFGLKGEVATATLTKTRATDPLRNIETTLHAFRRIELDFLRELVNELEREVGIDQESVSGIENAFVEKRKKLLDLVKEQLSSGYYGDVTTARLLNCLNEVYQNC